MNLPLITQHRPMQSGPQGAPCIVACFVAVGQGRLPGGECTFSVNTSSYSFGVFLSRSPSLQKQLCWEEWSYMSFGRCGAAFGFLWGTPFSVLFALEEGELETL